MKKKKPDKIIVFNFFSYQEYLDTIYKYLKEHRRGFSHRSFALDAGISSPNYLFRVIKGERNLTSNYVPSFCKVLALNKMETKYFETLVHFNNEKNSSLKEGYLRKLLLLRYSKTEYKIEDKKLLFFSKWYYPVIRELVVILNFKEDYNVLARSCIPRISSIQAKNAVKYLIKNGYISKHKDNGYIQTNPIISTAAEVNSTLLRKYHKNTITQCVEIIDDVNLKDREISSLTMNVTLDTYNKMKLEIQSFKKRLLAMTDSDKKGELVCFAGFQLIPKSKLCKVESE